MRALELLEKAVHPDIALANVCYYRDFASNKVVYETDGLLILDNIAVVVEAKSNRLRPNAHNVLDPPELLWQALEPLVKTAVEQGERIRPLLLDNTHLRISRATDFKMKAQVEVIKKNMLLDVSGPSHLGMVRAG
ncbi:hypothetical protein FCN77_23115 [Arthrobacter sp. 24S4-2]|uniref:hypothetical protein n=1 Tax=Arthrobacter sp. 24S4-2 TaxID=2575374 RepID=UPI0010C79784|nr:hypothetical protein [Arthrobacter sp. 24S4-2]QCP00073.1 hypothetical protein FCN77_23115 [Arthrobacter sp. 24S4-2]